MKKILVIRADGIGDVVMSTPFISQLRELFPKSEIVLLAATASADLVKPMPVFDKIIYADLPWFFKNGKLKFKKLFHTILMLRKEKFDLAIDLRGDFRNIILMSVANVKHRLGADITGCGYMLTHKVDVLPNSHMVDVPLAMINFLNSQSNAKPSLKLWITDMDRKFAQQFLKANHIDHKSGVAMFHPGAKWQGRKWATENYAKIADLLVSKYGVQVILSGSNDDIDTVRQISLQMKHPSIVAAGKTSLTQMLALMEQSILFLGVDSGPVHMATAMGTKTVAIYGPAKKEAVGPWGENCTVITKQDSFACSPCTQIKCLVPEKNCMDAVTPESVWEVIDNYMKSIFMEKMVN